METIVNALVNNIIPEIHPGWVSVVLICAYAIYRLSIVAQKK